VLTRSYSTTRSTVTGAGHTRRRVALFGSPSAIHSWPAPPTLPSIAARAGPPVWLLDACTTACGATFAGDAWAGQLQSVRHAPGQTASSPPSQASAPPSRRPLPQLGASGSGHCPRDARHVGVVPPSPPAATHRSPNRLRRARWLPESSTALVENSRAIARDFLVDCSAASSIRARAQVPGGGGVSPKSILVRSISVPPGIAASASASSLAASARAAEGARPRDRTRTPVRCSSTHSPEATHTSMSSSHVPFAIPSASPELPSVTVTSYRESVVAWNGWTRVASGQLVGFPPAATLTGATTTRSARTPHGARSVRVAASTADAPRRTRLRPSIRPPFADHEC